MRNFFLGIFAGIVLTASVFLCLNQAFADSADRSLEFVLNRVWNQTNHSLNIE